MATPEPAFEVFAHVRAVFADGAETFGFIKEISREREEWQYLVETRNADDTFSTAWFPESRLQTCPKPTLVATWERWRTVMEEQTLFRMAEWEVDIPSSHTMPPPALEKEISQWCRTLAQNMLDPLIPPENVRPWILARLLMTRVQSGREAENGSPVPEITPANISWMLVEGWDLALFPLWKMNAEMSRKSAGSDDR